MDTTTVSGNPTLDWLTLLAASVAAVGAILGPIITYRSVMKTIQRDKDEFVESQRQKDIDLYVSYALDDNAVIAAMGVRQLLYLRETGKLSDEQSNAVAEAVAASLAIAQTALEESPGSTAVTAEDGRAG